MRHYFLNSEKNKTDYFTFTETFLNNSYTFKSCSDVFSKDKIDDGTKILLKTIIDNYDNLAGDVLDFGCGLGPVGIVLQKTYNNLFVTMIDVNKTAVELAQQNVKLNNVSNVEVFESNLTQKVTRQYDYVITNPPIKAGKETLFGFITSAFSVLKDGGELILVIRKDKGQESLMKHMKNVFNNAEILNRDSGYYILKSVKK